MKYILPKKTAPHAASSLLLGIGSIVFQCAFIGMILGIIGVVLSNKGQKACRLNPMAYKNKEMLTVGKILSICGIVIGALILIFLILEVICLTILGVDLFVLIGGFDYFADLYDEVGETLYY
ncbi:MAG: hypothetical protein K5864_00105 [Bacteroidales bacterium]|nr:hypothetical protein [Bacteroidales bacterium]